MKTIIEATNSVAMSWRVIRPAGRCRPEVRGFWESMRLSIIRFADMPSVRAEIMAIVIQLN